MTLKTALKLVGVTALNLALGIALIFVILNLSNQSFSFWSGWVALAVVGAIIVVAWLAASDITSDKLGTLIIIGLMVVVLVLYSWAFTSGLFAGWSWIQFGLGFICVAIVAASGFTNFYYKYKTRN